MPNQQSFSPLGSLAGVVETTSPVISGWVAASGSGEPPEVVLSIDGTPLVSIKAETPRPDVAHALGYEGAGFCFRPAESLLAEIPLDSTVTASSGDAALVLAPGVSACIGSASPGNGRLSSMLRDGYVVSAKSGALFRPIGAIEGWREKITTLYQQARDVFRHELGLELLVFYGSLLGLVRDGDFIPRDDDFDAAFVVEATDCEELGARFVQVGRRLGALDWTVEMFSAGNMHLRRADLPGALDVFVLGIIDQRLIGYELNSPMPKEAMAPADLPALGALWTVPAGAEEILKAIYGPSWRKPDPAFQWRRTPETASSMTALDAAIRRHLDQIEAEGA